MVGVDGKVFVAELATCLGQCEIASMLVAPVSCRIEDIGLNVAYVCSETWVIGLDHRGEMTIDGVARF